jgi:hypothetical protein
MKNPLAIGIETRTNRGQIPYFEFDQGNILDDQLEQIKIVAKRHGLGNGFVYSTNRGFHLVFWNDTLNLQEYLNIISELDCPKQFKKIVEKRGSATNRCAGKYLENDLDFIWVIRTGKKNTARGNTRKAFFKACGKLHASIPKKLLKANPK